MLKTVPITLIESYMLSPRVKQFVFKVNQESNFHYIPGQFITIQFLLNEKLLRRSYSIANVPMKNNIIEFAAGYVDNGPATNLLFNLKPGETLDMAGPFGRLVLKDDIPKRYILIATSTGVTPYKSMLEQLQIRLEQNPELEIIILQGVQTKNDLLYKNEFQNFSNINQRVKFYCCYSKENFFEENEHLGYIQSFLPKLNLNSETDIIYLCGNPGMIDDSFEYLKNIGFNPQQIIREKYISGK